MIRPLFQCRTAVIISLLTLAVTACFAQSDTLALSSGTAAANGTVSLNLVLTSIAGGQPAALQWTFSYPAANLLSLAAVAGSSATAAGKSVTCLAYGTTASLMANGTVAVVSVTVAGTGT